MSGKRYSDEFKLEAVRQVTQQGHTVADVAERLGASTKSLYKWMTQLRDDETRRKSAKLQAAQKELRRSPRSVTS